MARTLSAAGAAITEPLGISYPLVAFSQSARVGVAVSRAGGLGVLGAGQLTVDQLERTLAWMHADLGARRSASTC
jgi:NAD(P)H-dependent flavin oxidoreductase YrpB (nitropropane dioxygenase family)